MPTESTTLTACRSALARLHGGMVPLRTVPAAARRVLQRRGLVAEHTTGYLELTSRGRGYATTPAHFEI